MRPDFDAGALLDDWFAGTREDPDAIEARMRFWFSVDADRDRRLAERYADHHEAAARGRWNGIDDSAEGRLALILLLDQVPRNIYRGTAAAFATDSLALDLCLSGHDVGLDAGLRAIERVFFWMPLQHVEDLELQDLGVRLYESLAGEDPERSELWNGFAKYARLHCDIIAKFGRFPHRNQALGRESTPEEADWLKDGESFGQ
jgi:uncharacterized protein (DUF924 family)